MEDLHDDSFSPSSLGSFRDESERRLYEALRKNPNLDYDPEEDEVTAEQYEAIVERKKRIAARREEGRRLRAQEAAQRAAKEAGRGTKPAAGTRKVPAATKPVTKKPVTKEAANRSGKNKGEGNERVSLRESIRRRKERIGRKIFYIGLGVYAFILIVLAFIFLRYTYKCLRRYESTRYENVIGDLVKEFTLSVKDGSILEKVEIPEHACAFESEDLYRTTYLRLLQSSDTFSYEKDKKSYDTSHPVYDIFSSTGDLVAKIKLKSVNEKTIFAILRVGDWKIDTVTPVFSVTTNSYRISVPDNYKVTVNGIEVTDDFRKGDPVPIEVKLAADVMSHVQIPSIVTYEIDGLAEKPTIVIYNSVGEQVDFTQDEKGNIEVAAEFGVKKDNMSEDRKSFALETAQMWTDFLNRDLSGPRYGIATIQKRLIKNSAYYKQAENYIVIDITFVSNHYDANPKYTDVSVSEYTEYSDECYSCRIKFTKHIILTKTGQPRVVPVDTTNFYVYVDDSDDGVINPHWVLADMIATTTQTTILDEN